MKLISSSFADGQTIPDDFSFCNPDPAHHVCLGKNLNPHLAWSDVPPGTKSFALICHDPDVPSRGDDVNQEGRTVPATLPRVDFFHWVLIDLPAGLAEIEAGEFSRAVTPRGKAGPATLHGARHGINDYTGWFAGDGDMRGDYFGYDGPCPPWNDARMHRYQFKLYALSVDRCAVDGDFTAQDVLAAIKSVTLAEAQLMGTYAINPDIAKTGAKK
jgi:Raf kinase inhibitor-like YbhB/YbcL family protein